MATTRLITTVTLLACLWANPATAQVPPAPAPRPEAAPASRPVVERAVVEQPPAERPLVDLTFRGGSLQDFVDLLRSALVEQNPGELAPNILLPEIAATVRIPALELQQVEIGAVLDCLQPLLASGYSVFSQRMPENGGRRIYALTITEQRRSNGETESSKNPTGTSVFSLKGLIREVGDAPVLHADTVLTAVEAGLELGRSLEDTELAYHEASGLLFVRGKLVALRLVETTLKVLESDLREERRLHEIAGMMEEPPAEPGQTRK